MLIENGVTLEYRCDVYYSSVSLLLPMNGANNSTMFTDYSPSPKTVTPNGDAKISTTQSKWNGSSGYFDGSGDYLTVPDSSDWYFGTGNFTVELWMSVVSLPGTIAFVTSQWETAAGSDTNSSFAIMLEPSGNIRGSVAYDGINQPAIVSASPVITLLSTFYHIALVKSGTTLALYANGNSLGTASVPGTINNSTLPVYIGGRYGGTNFFTGYINDLRITTGVARYTSNFSVPTAPFPLNGC